LLDTVEPQSSGLAKRFTPLRAAVQGASKCSYYLLTGHFFFLVLPVSVL